jgi:hypothetical protein
VIEAAAAQSDDGVGTSHGPEHTGLLEAYSDDRLASGFDDAGANEEPLFPKPLSLFLFPKFTLGQVDPESGSDSGLVQLQKSKSSQAFRLQ